MNINQLMSELLEAINPESNFMYRELAMKFHPDRGGDQEKMKKLNAARQNGDWDKIRRMYHSEMGEEEQETETKIPPNVKDKFKLYNNWAKEIEEELHNIKIIIEIQGTGINALVHYTRYEQKKSFYLPKIERFKSKYYFKQEILKRINF